MEVETFKSHMGGRTFEGKPGGELTIESGKCWLGEEFSTERVRNGRLEAQVRSGRTLIKEMLRTRIGNWLGGFVVLGY